MLKECLENVRRMAPLIHNITNYVTINDVANVLLACGASPIMSDEAEDAAQITSICAGLNINLGQLHKTGVEGMLRAGKRANELGHPVLLDPVGVGVSDFRRETALMLLREIRFTAIRGKCFRGPRAGRRPANGGGCGCGRGGCSDRKRVGKGRGFFESVFGTDGLRGRHDRGDGPDSG